MSLSAKMATPLAASLAGRLAGNAGEDRIAAILGDRLRWSSDAEVGSYLLGTSPDVQTLYNNAVTGLEDATQGSAAARPHLSTFGAHNVLDFSGSQGLVSAGAANVFSIGDRPTAFSVVKYDAFGSVRASLEMGDDGLTQNRGLALDHYSVSGQMRAYFNTNLGYATAGVAFSDTANLHVVRGTLTSTTIEISVDGASPSVTAHVNTGLSRNLPYLNIGQYTGGGLRLNGVLKRVILANNVTPAEIAEIESLLLAEIA